MRAARPALVVLLAALLAGCAAGGGPTPTATPTVAGSTPAPGSAGGPPDVTVTVVAVVDGDTLRVRYPNGTADDVRLLGVDAPEVHAPVTPDEFEGVPNTSAGRACLRRWGRNATAFARETLLGRRVHLEFDLRAPRRGYYGRLLAYVSFGGRSFNYRLVAAGYARVYGTVGDFSQADRFLAAEARARANRTGLWACAHTGAPSPTADGALRIVAIRADAPGDDHENPNGEYVVFENAGTRPLDLSGWTVRDEAGHTYTFPAGFTLGPGERVTLHTGDGTDTATRLYWGVAGAVWNNDGDTVRVSHPNGTVVAETSYGYRSR